MKFLPGIKNSLSVLICGLLLLLLSFSVSYSQDVFIQTHKGDLRINQEKGKIVVNRILGNGHISTGAGSIKLGTVDGDVDSHTLAGDIEIGNVMGSVEAITKSGNISIGKTGGVIVAETNLGEILVESANRIQATTIVGGDIKIMNLVGYAKILSVGNILLMIDEKISGPNICDLATRKGDITICLPENVGATLIIRTPITMNPKRQTNIESDFAFTRFDQRIGGDEKYFIMTTDINDGGKIINLYIEKGNVYIRKMNRRKEV